MKRSVSLLVLVVCLLTGCTSPVDVVDDSVHIRYTVTGEHDATILYVNDGGEFRVEYDCALPWSYEFTTEQGNFICVRAWIPDTWDVVTVSIYRDSELLATDTSSGLGSPATVHGES